MYKPVTMDARRVDELSRQVSGLRFFQQLPRHLVTRFLHSMVIQRLRAESLVFKEGELGDSFAVIMRGTIAVYAKKTNQQVKEKAEEIILPTVNLEGEADVSAPPSPRTAAAAGIQPKKRRQLKGAAGGSISIPPTAKLNPITGSISIPAGSLAPTTSLVHPPPPPQPDHGFSLVVNTQQQPQPQPHEHEQQRGISLVPGWVTPPTSDDDNESESDSDHSDSGPDTERSHEPPLSPAERSAAAAAAVDRARHEARAKLEASESALADAELAAIIAEEAELQRLEAADARAEMVCLTTLHACDSFGLLTILESAKRAATLITLDDTELAVLTRSAYEELMRQLNRDPRNPNLPRCHIPSPAKYLRLLRMPAEQRDDAYLTYLITPLLAHNRVLQMLDSRTLQLVASSMKLLRAPKSGMVLQKQGDEAQWVYVVIKGSISEHRRPELLEDTNTSITILPSHTLTNTNTIATTSAATAVTPANDSPSSPHPARRQLSPTSSRRNLSPLTHRSRTHAHTFSPTHASPSASSHASKGGDILSTYGPCTRLLLTGDLSPYPDRDIQSPSFWSLAPCTLLTREPCVLAKMSVDYLAHIFMGCVKPMKQAAQIREALLSTNERRTDGQLELLDSILKNVGFFQFKPPALRKALCGKMHLTHRRANTIIFHQDEPADAFYIILSGSVSIHQLPLQDPPGPPLVLDDRLFPHRTIPEFGVDILKTFGPCLSLAKPQAHFGDQALISTLPRNMTIITRGPVELITISRKDYLAIFVPVLDDMQYHASKALQLLSRPQRTPAIVNQLLDVLKHVGYFADMPVSLRSFAIRHMEVETVEGDSVIFLEDDEPDYMYVIMSGSVGVHIHDKKQKELLRQAKLEGGQTSTTNVVDALSEGDTTKRLKESEDTRVDKITELHHSIDDEPTTPTPLNEDDLLAEQMQRDAEAEVRRLMDEKKAARQQTADGSDESDTTPSDEDDDDDDTNSTMSGSSSNLLRSPKTSSLPTAAAARMQASSRGDVFTASGAGQYALARKLRSNSVIGASAAPDALAHLAHLKRAEAEEFKRKMALAAAVVDESRNDAIDQAENGTIDQQLSAVLADGSTGTHVQCGHLTAAERTEQYGPCVVQLPSGSVVGEVALTNAGQRNRRTATIITMEPTFFIKLHGDVVSRLTFGRSGASGGSLSQDAMANFLKTLDMLRIVKGSATGAGTGSHATFKRLAYHMKDRTLAVGVKLIEQGSKAEHVYFIVSGSILMARNVLLNGVKHKPGKRRERFITHTQIANESFQRIDTAYLPESAYPPHTPPPPTPTAAVTTGGATQPSTTPTTVAPLPSGMHLRIELTSIGSGELIGGLESLHGSIHNSSFQVTSSECVVLQMKRSHFLNLFPSRALELVKNVGEQRSKLYQTRVEKFITMRCKDINANPYAAGLANMSGSGLEFDRTGIVDEASENDDAIHAADVDGRSSHVDHSDPKVTQQHVPGMHQLPPSTPTLTGSIENGRPKSAKKSSQSSAAHLVTPNHQHGTRKTVLALKDPNAIAGAVSSLDDPTATPTPIHTHDISSPGGTTRRSHVLAPPTNKTPVLQSATLMHSLQLKEITTTPPLTPVQKALGYTSDPIPPTFSFAEQEEMEGRRELTIRPHTSATDDRPNARQALHGSQSEIVLRPHTSQGTTTTTVATPTHPSADVSLADASMQLLISGPTGSPALSSQDLADQLSASSKLEQDAASAADAAARRRLRRGSMKIMSTSTGVNGPGLGSVEYNAIETIPIPTSEEVAALTNTLSTGANAEIIGIHELSDQRRDAIEDEQLLTSRVAPTSQLPPTSMSQPHPLATKRPSFSLAPRVGLHAPLSLILPSPSGSTPPLTERSVIGPNGQPHTSRIGPDGLPHKVTTPTTILQSQIELQKAELEQESKNIDPTPRHTRSLSQMSVEARAIVLMRAEKAQILWEASEENRRGHKLMEKLRPTSYNMGEEEKQAMLSRSLAWDKVQRTDPSSQSNAFLHSASPPLAVMHNQIPKTSSQPSSPITPGPSFAEAFDLASIGQTDTSRPIMNGVGINPTQTPTRAFAPKGNARDPARLHIASSPIIRSLLTPLVDSPFTSLFSPTSGVVGNGLGDSAPFFSAPSVSAHSSPSRRMASKATQPVGRKVGLGSPLGRPQTAGELGRTASESNLHTRSTPTTPIMAQASTNKSKPSSPAHRTTPIAMGGFGGRSTPTIPSPSSHALAGSNRYFGLGATTPNSHHAALDPPTDDISGFNTTPVHALQRPSTGSLPTSPLAAHQQQQHARPATSVGTRRPFTAATKPTPQSTTPIDPVVSPWSDADPTDDASSLSARPTQLHVVLPHATTGANPLVASDPSVYAPLSPIRHTRTSSLGSFMSLANAGVDRRPTTAPINTPQEERNKNTIDASHLISEDDEVNDGDGDGDDAGVVSDAARLGGVVARSSPPSVSHLSPHATHPLHPTRPNPSFPPSQYAASHTTAFTKQSFIDDRTEASLMGAKVVQDSHQSIYSRARAMMPLPGTKANPASGPEALTKDEYETLRRKRLYGIAAPKIGPDTPSAFAKVISLSDSLPGKLLASRSANSSKKARLDELAVKAAARDGLASKILNDFREASERQ